LARLRLRALAPLALAAALAVPAAMVRAGEPDGTASPGLGPSIHYEQAQQHAADRVHFEPGERASVKLRPRVGALESAATEGSSAPVSASGLRREVFGFLPYWELSDGDTTLHYDLLSTIAYFSVPLKSTGDLVKQDSDGSIATGWAGWTSSRMTTVINDAHASGTRVVVSVTFFAWTGSGITNMTNFLSSTANRARAAGQIAQAVRDRGADGVNLDFEPIPDGQSANFVSFVREVRAALDAKASGYQLTFDATGWIGNYDVAALTAPGAADAVFIMGYDYRGSTSGRAGSVDPLTGPRYDLTDTVEAYLARTDASKIILGVPYYGRAWSTETDDPNALTLPQNSTNGYSSAIFYETAVEAAAQYGRRWDATEQAPWFAYQRSECGSCPLHWREGYYDDAQSLGARYDMVNRLGIRGTGIWALGYDGTRGELWDVLAAKFRDDGTPPLAGIVPLAETAGDEGFAVRWTGRDDLSGVASYDVEVAVDSGAWAGWLARTAATSAVYPGRTGHAYSFRVRARDGAGNVGAWDVGSRHVDAPTLANGGFARVVVDGLNMRSAPGTSATALGRLSTGDLLELIGGPTSADGYTWWQVTGPLREWAPVSSVQRGFWVAAGTSGSPYIAAAQPPNATAVAAAMSGVGHRSAFSPNGDGRYDRLAIRYHLRWTFTTLQLRVFDAASGSLLGSIDLPGRAAGDEAYTWDGTLGGSRLGDRTVTLQLVGSAGGRTYSWPAADPVAATLGSRGDVRIDTTPPEIVPSAPSSRGLSPNGDGVNETVTLRATASGAASWRIGIWNAAGGWVRAYPGEGGSLTATWDGRNAHGDRVRDGTYTVYYRAGDGLGNRGYVRRTITVDTVRPSAAVTATPGVFTPNGDGDTDTVRLDWSASEAVHAVVSILSGSTVVRSFAADGAAGSFTWDGRSASGSGVADGTYTAVLHATDPAGNSASASTSVAVNRSAGFLDASPMFFYPQDGDALARTTIISARLAVKSSTALRILDAEGRIVRQAWEGRSFYPGTIGWTWDGRDDAGNYVPKARYTGQLIVSNAVGRLELRTPLVVMAFALYPSADPVAAGETLKVRISSAEPLKSPPTVTFRQSGLADVAKTATSTGGSLYEVSFTVAPAGSGPALLLVTGTDTSGGYNGGSATITVK